MATKITVDSYVKQIVGKGVSSSNLFDFTIQPTKQLKEFFEDNDTGITGTGGKFEAGVYKTRLLCQDIQIPGSTFNTVDLKMPKKGLTQKVAAAKMYNELDVSFICDLGSSPISFFKLWQDMIIGIQPQKMKQNPGLYTADSPFVANEHQAYAQRYYDHYTCNVIIKKLEKYGSGKEDYQEVFSVQLAKAYPYSFSTVPYSAGPSQAVKATVAFFYEYQQFVFKPSSPPRTS